MNYESVCRKTIEVALSVGSFLKNEFQHFDISKIEYKGLNNLVSYVDREAEKRLMAALIQIVPEAAFITEESPDKQTLTDNTYHWVIDPLDGTTNFLHGLPVFAISIALIEGTKAKVGVVYEVNRGECFYAWEGGGAYCNDKIIQVGQQDTLSESLLATGFPYRDFGKMKCYLCIIEDLMKHCHGLRRMGSAAVDLVYVACGRFQGFFEYNLSPWDVAGGALIVQEAGGTVSTFHDTDDFIFGNEIVATGKIHKPLLEIIQTHWD